MPAVVEIERAKASSEYARAREELGEREARIDSLYYIRDEQGDKTLFKRNAAQVDFEKEMAARNVLPKARKLGFSTFIAILMLDECLFTPGHFGRIIDRTMDDAEDKLEIVRYAYQNMPRELQRVVPLTTDNDREMIWANGSRISVGTTSRGGTPQDLHISEYGKISTDNPKGAKEIKTGAIQAVPATGRVWAESTAHGTSGEFREMCRIAENAKIAKQPLSALDFKFHFYGWWMKAEYRLAPNLVVIPRALADKYFPEIEHKIGRKLDGWQRAWYAKKLEELGPDDMKEEFPSTADELFYISNEGSYWREEITKARREGRVGQPVPYDPTRGVNTTWDIGEDMTSIWFHQSDGVRHRFIDYYEEEGGSLQRAIGVLDDKHRDRGFVYLKHWGPHDFDNRDWANQSKTRRAMALELGLKVDVVPRITDKGHAIEAGRRLLALSYFCEEYCSIGVERISNYRKKWNKQLAVYSSIPVHDIACHAADSFMNLAMGLKPEPVKDKPARERRRGSQWGA